MPKAAVSESEFIELISEYGPVQAGKRLGIEQRAIFRRLSRIEEKSGPIKRPNVIQPSVPGRIEFECKSGVILVASDPHYWPDIVTTAHQAFVKFIAETKPKAVVMNGDVFDGARISRHAAIGWERKPSVIHELEACQERLSEISKAAGRAKKFWPLGNHDARFESRLANVAPEYARVNGVHLSDHFPLWEKCWSVFVNGNTVIKHRGKGGIHATHNNAVQSGMSMVTGHLHSLKVTPWTDYTGDRWGVDTGTLAEPFGPQFTDYMEDGPRSWRSGFAVLTYDNYELLQPELVRVHSPGKIDFRGKLHAV